MSDVMFLGVGDVGPVHGPADGFPIERYTELVRPTLAKADLRFGNCERQYSTRGVVNDESPHGRQPPEMARIFDDCGFDVLSLANNHMYDYGPEALLDTRALMVDKGFKVTGAGKDLQEARQPAIIDVKGVTVGFLAYCSFFSAGCAGSVR
ncbi:MAG: CapA family protein [Pseudolabrys sp.]